MISLKDVNFRVFAGHKKYKERGRCLTTEEATCLLVLSFLPDLHSNAHTNGAEALVGHIQGNEQNLHARVNQTGMHGNVPTRSFSPLFAARIALRECETFFFGAARTRPSQSNGNVSASGKDGETAGGLPVITRPGVQELGGSNTLL